MLKVAVSLFVVWTLLLLTPGPDFLLIVRNTISAGLKGGLLTAFGIGLGICFHATFVILGIDVLSKNPLMFSVIKFIGASYLVYIGVRGFFSLKRLNNETEFSVRVGDSFSKKEFFKNGLLSDLFNPKLPIIMVAVFTQLIPPKTSVYLKFLFALEIVFISTFMWSLISVFFSYSKVYDKFAKFQNEILTFSNSVLILLGGMEIFSVIAKFVFNG